MKSHKIIEAQRQCVEVNFLSEEIVLYFHPDGGWIMLNVKWITTDSFCSDVSMFHLNHGAVLDIL